MSISLKDLIKKNNASLVESLLITLNKEELLTEYSSTYGRKTLLMAAIETGNAQMVKAIISNIPPDIARIQLESLVDKTLIELAIEFLPNEGLTLIIEKLKQYPDIFQRQINKHNIIQSALISSHVENLMITLELMKGGKKSFKQKLNELTSEQIFELLRQFKKYLKEAQNNDDKKSLIATFCEIAECIKDSPKFTTDVKTEMLSTFHYIANSLDQDVAQEKERLIDTLKIIESQEAKIPETKNLANVLLQEHEQTTKRNRYF